MSETLAKPVLLAGDGRHMLYGRPRTPAESLRLILLEAGFEIGEFQFRDGEEAQLGPRTGIFDGGGTEMAAYLFLGPTVVLPSLASVRIQPWWSEWHGGKGAGAGVEAVALGGLLHAIASGTAGCLPSASGGGALTIAFPRGT